jgi:hypothetical protein
MRMSEFIGYIWLDFFRSYYCFHSEFQILEYTIVTHFAYGVLFIPSLWVFMS